MLLQPVSFACLPMEPVAAPWHCSVGVARGTYIGHIHNSDHSVLNCRLCLASFRCARSKNRQCCSLPPTCSVRAVLRALHSSGAHPGLCPALSRKALPRSPMQEQQQQQRLMRSQRWWCLMLARGEGLHRPALHCLCMSDSIGCTSLSLTKGACSPSLVQRYALFERDKTSETMAMCNMPLCLPKCSIQVLRLEHFGLSI